MSKLRRINRLVWGIFILCMLAATAHADTTITVTQVDPSNFPEMVVYISITDAGGSIISSLTRDDFVVTEDGQPVRITDFAGAEQARPVDIVFVFDTTGSMDEEIEGVKETSIAFANQLRDNNRDFRLGLVAFGDEIREVRNRDGTLTADAEEFKGWIEQLQAEGGDDEPEISLDGLQRATQMTFRTDTQKVLLLITDAPPHERGDGTRFSQVVPEALVAQLRDHGYTVYAVAYEDPRFRRAAHETGGKFYDIHREPDFTGIIDEIGGLIAAQYRLTYISPRSVYDGTRRNVVVEVAGKRSGGTYLEKHLLNIESNPTVGLLLFLPLLLALLLPMAVGKLRFPRSRPAVAGTTPGPTPQAILEATQVREPGVAAATCPHCGHVLRPGARFCGRCGQQVAATTLGPPPSTCPRCGQQVRPGTSFCSSCGQRL